MLSRHPYDTTNALLPEQAKGVVVKTDYALGGT